MDGERIGTVTGGIVDAGKSTMRRGLTGDGGDR
jgi:hypothetical protein